MRYPAKETAEKHQRIVREASQMFREHGFNDVTVSQVMHAAGLTHGAFYSHFSSKESLMTEAVKFAMENTRKGIQDSFGTPKGRAAYLGRYLSPNHRDHPGTGCAMAALSGEIRNEPEVKETFTVELKAILEAMGGKRGDALLTLAAMVGSIALARAVADETFSREMLTEIRKKLQEVNGCPATVTKASR